MSLRIIYGRSGTGKSTYCLQEIKEHKNKTFIIVPEQFSYSVEKKLLGILETQSTVNTEVINFKKIAERVFTEVGGTLKTALSKSAKAMLIFNILESQKDNLEFLGNSPENVDLVMALIAELKKHNIDLDKIDNTNFSGNLLSKIGDLKVIDAKYKKFFKDKFIDDQDTLAILTEKIQESNIFNDAEVYIDEFTGFTSQEYDIIAKIMKKAKMVTICVCTDNLERLTNIETDIFYENKRLANKFLDYANENNIKIEDSIKLKKQLRLEYEELQALEESIYSATYKKFNKNNEKIKLFLTSNPYSEIEYVAKEITKLVRDENLKYQDISVITSDIGSISGIVKTVFARFNIPVFINEKSEVSQNLVIKYVLSILEIFSNSWSHEAVFNYIKLGFLDLNENDVYKLENYCTKMGIRGSKWYKEDWAEFNELRKVIVAPLLDFKENLNRSKTTREITTEIFKFIEKNEVQSKLNDKITKLEEQNRLDIANEYNMSLEILFEVFDEIVMLFGDERISFEKYKKLIEVALTYKEFGQIPQVIDQVIIGNVDRSKTHDVKVTFLIGLNDEKFPSINKNEGFLNDSEKECLKNMGLEISKTTLEELYNNQFDIYKTFCIAKEQLFLSYTSSDIEGKTLRPSMLINKIKRIFPNLKEESDIINKKSEISTKDATFKELLFNIRKLYNGEDIDAIWFEAYNWYYENERKELEKSIKALQDSNKAENLSDENIRKMFGEKLKTSVSKLEQYKKCPFSFFVKYGLKLKEKEEFKISSLDTGSFMHDIIDTFFDRIKNLKGIQESEIEETILAIVKEKLNLKKNYIFSSSPKFVVLTNRLIKIVTEAIKYIVEQMQNSDFEILGNEIEFYKEIGNVEITGKIDRIDIAKDQYIRVIDYKSSNRKIDFDEMLKGTQIQLITYMDVASEIQNKQPVGALYFNLIEPIINKNLPEEQVREELKKEFRMNGIVLADVQVIKMMDKKLETGSSTNIPVYLSKDGQISKSKSNVLSKEEFEDLQNTIKEVIKKIAQEILSGNIDINPVYDKRRKALNCEYCEYKTICRKI